MARRLDSEDLADRCRDLRLQGYSQPLIAQTLGVSQSTVRYHTRDIVVKVPKTKVVYRRKAQLDEVPLPPSDKLAYLIGVMCGDGCLSQAPRTVQLCIACDTRYPNLIEIYCGLIFDLMGRKAKIFDYKTYAHIRINSVALPQILGLPTGAKAQDYPIPKWIWEQDSYLRFWVRGLIETDGGVYHEYRNGGWCSRCLFTAKNKAIMDGFLRATHRLGYPFREVSSSSQARLTRTALVKKLVEELDIQKERTYIQKSPTVRKSKAKAINLTNN